MNASFNEYVLSEPILRVLTARGYEVQSEAVCPGNQTGTSGRQKEARFRRKRQRRHSGFRSEVGEERKAEDK